MRLDDPRWEQLHGGYRMPYDASPSLRALETGDDGAFASLWENLHHQGDVGEASYAALPELVRIARARAERDWNFYGLINVIELCRHGNNPPLPDSLSFEYHAALRDALAMALADVPTIDDAFLLKQALATIAIAKHQRLMGNLLFTLDESEMDAILQGKFVWTD